LELLGTLGGENDKTALLLHSRAGAEYLSNNLISAERDYKEALRIFRVVGNAEGVADAIGNLAKLALDRQDWLQAGVLASEALSKSEELGRQQAIAFNCDSLAEALVQQGNRVEGLLYARRAVEIYTRLRSPELPAARQTLSKCES